jgi:hypothetical protein
MPVGVGARDEAAERLVQEPDHAIARRVNLSASGKMNGRSPSQVQLCFSSDDLLFGIGLSYNPAPCIPPHIPPLHESSMNV